MPKDTADYRIGRSRPGLGLGLFACRKYRNGEQIVEYSGNRILTRLADNLPTRYLFEISKEWTVDGSPRSNVARYINHSCDPNCETDIEDEKIFVYASRAIDIGEELAFDYGEEYFDEFIRPYGCKCAACAQKSGFTRGFYALPIKRPEANTSAPPKTT